MKTVTATRMVLRTHLRKTRTSEERGFYARTWRYSDRTRDSQEVKLTNDPQPPSGTSHGVAQLRSDRSVVKKLAYYLLHFSYENLFMSIPRKISKDLDNSTGGWSEYEESVFT